MAHSKADLKEPPKVVLSVDYLAPLWVAALVAVSAASMVARTAGL